MSVVNSKYITSALLNLYLRLWLLYLSCHLHHWEAEKQSKCIDSAIVVPGLICVVVTANPVASAGGALRCMKRLDTDASLSLSASAVIAGGVIGFLFAIFLILLLVYRMRKKDEGSYDLGERKPSGAAYQKAPTKEFYA